MSDVQCATREGQGGAGKTKRPKVGSFTGQTENWFLQAERLVEQAASGELPPEQGGGYLETPWWHGLLSARGGVLAAILFAGGAAVLWSLA